MWPRRYFAARMFAPRYFPQSQGGAPTPIVPDNRTAGGLGTRVSAIAGRQRTQGISGRPPND